MGSKIQFKIRKFQKKCFLCALNSFIFNIDFFFCSMNQTTSFCLLKRHALVKTGIVSNKTSFSVIHSFLPQKHFQILHHSDLQPFVYPCPLFWFSYLLSSLASSSFLQWVERFPGTAFSSAEFFMKCHFWQSPKNLDHAVILLGFISPY